MEQIEGVKKYELADGEEAMPDDPMRRNKAYTLYIKGWSKSRIAARFKVTQMTVWRWINAVAKESKIDAESAATIRQVEVDRLDDIEGRLLRQMQQAESRAARKDDTATERFHKQIYEAIRTVRRRYKDGQIDADTYHGALIQLSRANSDAVKTRVELRKSKFDLARLALAYSTILEAKRKLLGLDEPDKVQIAGVIYTVREASPDCPDWDKPAQVEAKVRAG